MENWVLLRAEPDSIIASLIEGRLKAEGIPVITEGEALGTVYPTNVGPTLGTHIYVPASKLEEANAILDNLEDV